MGRWDYQPDREKLKELFDFDDEMLDEIEEWQEYTKDMDDDEYWDAMNKRNGIDEDDEEFLKNLF